jgi:hypothetical protein
MMIYSYIVHLDFDVSRLDLQHYAVQHATGRRFFAPIDAPSRAIDIGTGTGIWMLVSAYDTHTHYLVFIGYLHTLTCRKWPQNFRIVNSWVLISHHYSQPPYYHPIANLSLSTCLMVSMEGEVCDEASLTMSYYRYSQTG